MSATLKEAKRLHDLGFAILWIKPNSKAPVKSKWTTGPRESWENLKLSYKPGFNVGVRLGAPSKILDFYLLVIDLDVKSSDPRHRAEAEAALLELFPELTEAPKVASGRGSGSSHTYGVSKEPCAPLLLRKSKELVKVFMPSAPIGKSQREALSEEDLNEGYRMRPAWEIAVMGEGQQVVLPPSTHPDTRKEYAWSTKLERVSDLPVLPLNFKRDLQNSRETTFDWTPEEYDLTFSSLPDDIIQNILYAEVEDRSAELFRVAIAMIKEGLTDRQIMTVLTDPENELGKTAYDHAKTSSRARAANWVYNYTLRKARKETDARNHFTEEVVVHELGPEEDIAQAKEFLTPPDWRELIERHGKGVNAGTPKSSLKNIILILANEVAPDVVRRDEFSIRDFYGHSTPWGGKAGAAIVDEDAIKIKVYLANRYRFEPNKELIWEALTYLAEKNSFDPVKNWLEALPEWDGENRLDFWLARNFEAEGDSDYLAQVFRKWMTAMVMRVYEPGSKFDWMPIFEGRQGVGKSSLGRLLVGDKYFVDWLPDLGDKDSALSLQGAWSVELGELASLRKQDVESSKAFITRTIDKVRPPYGRKMIESPRRCVFFGTTNNDTYLRDDSGNRRFKPVKVGQLDFEALDRDRIQLFAEALFIYKNGLETSVTLDIEGNARTYEQQIQKDKMVPDDSEIMREEILEFITKEDGNCRVNFAKFKIKNLFEDFNPLAKYKGDMRDSLLAAKALKALGANKWKSDGSNFWQLDIAKLFSRDSIGIGTKVTIPTKNLSNFDN